MSEAQEEEVFLDPVDIAAGSLMDALRELRAIPADDAERIAPIKQSALNNARYLQARGGGGLSPDQLTRIISALEKSV